MEKMQYTYWDIALLQKWRHKVHLPMFYQEKRDDKCGSVQVVGINYFEVKSGSAF